MATEKFIVTQKAFINNSLRKEGDVVEIEVFDEKTKTGMRPGKFLKKFTEAETKPAKASAKKSDTDF